MILKKLLYFIMIFLSLTSCAQNKISLFSKEYKIYPKINIPISADILLNNAATEFNTNFKTVTGQYLKIERSTSLNKNYNYIVLRVNPTQKENFCMYKKDRNIHIQGKTNQDLIYAINSFFKKYTTLNFKEKNKKGIEYTVINEINIPDKFSNCSSPEFEYREPYFSSNFNPNFRAWNKTNYLELEWGIWGHNLNKILKEYNLPESVYAKTGGNRNKKQYCFTSDSLFK
jgi:hypothetical protein